jgi:hypothetical protein
MSKKEIIRAATSTQEQRIEHWISQLEEQTRLLLRDIDIEEINHKERLGLALKMMSQIQHFVSMQQKTEVTTPANNNVNIMLHNLMQQMRGEEDTSAILPIATHSEFVDGLDAELGAELESESEFGRW